MESSNGRPDARVGQRIAGKTVFNPPPNRLPGNASRSEHTRRTRMPRECLPAFRSAPAAPELIQPSEGPFDHPAPSPSVRCHIRCCASRAEAQCGGHADLAGLTQHHNHGPSTQSGRWCGYGQNHEYELIGFMRFRGKQKLHTEIADECRLLDAGRFEAASGHEQKND